MIVDCVSCPVRGQRCDDCAVTVLFASGSAELLLDAAETRVVSVLVGAGLLDAGAAAGLRARREIVEHWGSVRDVG